MKLYISGPMTGYPDFNFPAFSEAAATLRALGFDVVSPHELDELDGIAPDPTGAMPDVAEYGAYLVRDVAAILEQKVQGIIVLPGWDRSGGARAEVAFARALGLPIYDYAQAFPSVDVDGPPTPEPRAEEETIVDPTTGGMKGRKPERMELLPWDVLPIVARVYAFGADKYDDHNWRKGYRWSLSFGALQRHLAAFYAGQDHDLESGLPHLAHAAFHVLALLAFMREHPEQDDRPSSVVDLGAELEAARAEQGLPADPDPELEHHFGAGFGHGLSVTPWPLGDMARILVPAPDGSSRSAILGLDGAARLLDHVESAPAGSGLHLDCQVEAGCRLHACISAGDADHVTLSVTGRSPEIDSKAVRITRHEAVTLAGYARWVVR